MLEIPIWFAGLNIIFWFIIGASFVWWNRNDDVIIQHHTINPFKDKDYKLIKSLIMEKVKYIREHESPTTAGQQMDCHEKLKNLTELCDKLDDVDGKTAFLVDRSRYG